MKLYRGDSLPSSVVKASRSSRGRTFAGHFCSNGLMAKFADGGSSDLLGGKDLLQLILEHVGYESGSESERLAYRSPLLSFSSSLDCAFTFCERRQEKRDQLVPCLFEDATHFIWELDVDPAECQTVGLYMLEYESDPINCLSITGRQINDGMVSAAESGDCRLLLSALASSIVQTYTLVDTEPHSAALIDVVRYIEYQRSSGGLAGRDQHLLTNACQRASRDEEWLLYPMDPMPDGCGFSARFSMNKHLRPLAWFRHRT